MLYLSSYREILDSGLICVQDSLKSSVDHAGYSGLDTALLHLFTIYGLPSEPNLLVLNGIDVPASGVTWNVHTKVGMACELNPSATHYFQTLSIALSIYHLPPSPSLSLSHTGTGCQCVTD